MLNILNIVKWSTVILKIHVRGIARNICDGKHWQILLKTTLAEKIFMNSNED